MELTIVHRGIGELVEDPEGILPDAAIDVPGTASPGGAVALGLKCYVFKSSRFGRC